jgi:hypothetical protein
MASHIEMKRLGDDADAVVRLVTFLQTIASAEWTEWELNFLDSLQLRVAKDPLTARQVEKLFELKDAAESFTRYQGFAVPALIRACFAHRLDLDDDDDVAFVERLAGETPKALKLRPLMRLVRCAREIDVIHDYAAAG